MVVGRTRLYRHIYKQRWILLNLAVVAWWGLLEWRWARRRQVLSLALKFLIYFLSLLSSLLEMHNFLVQFLNHELMLTNNMSLFSYFQLTFTLKLVMLTWLASNAFFHFLYMPITIFQSLAKSLNFVTLAPRSQLQITFVLSHLAKVLTLGLDLRPELISDHLLFLCCDKHEPLVLL